MTLHPLVETAEAEQKTNWRSPQGRARVPPVPPCHTPNPQRTLHPRVPHPREPVPRHRDGPPGWRPSRGGARRRASKIPPLRARPPDVLAEGGGGETVADPSGLTCPAGWLVGRAEGGVGDHPDPRRAVAAPSLPPNSHPGAAGGREKKRAVATPPGFWWERGRFVIFLCPAAFSDAAALRSPSGHKRGTPPLCPAAAAAPTLSDGGPARGATLPNATLLERVGLVVRGPPPASSPVGARRRSRNTLLFSTVAYGRARGGALSLLSPVVRCLCAVRAQEGGVGVRRRLPGTLRRGRGGGGGGGGGCGKAMRWQEVADMYIGGAAEGSGGAVGARGVHHSLTSHTSSPPGEATSPLPPPDRRRSLLPTTPDDPWPPQAAPDRQVCP